MKPECLAKEFEQHCRHLAETENALYTEFSRDKKAVVFSMYYRVVKIQLVYCWRWTDLAPPSVLYCRVYLNKNNAIFMPLPDVLSYLRIEDFRACYYPYIETSQRMRACFKALWSVIQDHISAMEKAGMTDQANTILRDWLNRDLKDDEPMDPDDEQMQQRMHGIYLMQEWIYVMRYTILDAYAAFLKGDIEKALKRYRKLEKSGLFPYEKDLCALLSAGGSIQPMPPECYAAKDFQDYSGQKQDWKGALLLYPAYAAFFCILLAVINGYLAQGTLVYSGVQWWFGMILGLMPPIFSYPLLQKHILKLISAKHWKQSKDFFEIPGDQKGLKWFSGIVLVICLVLEVWFCVAVPNMSMRLYETHGIYYSDEETLQRFDYDQVTAVYHIHARYNEYGGRVERDSYVLALSDGRYIDLDCEFSGPKEQLQVIEALIPGKPVIELDSERELP